jgi:hypothetical protein
MLINHDPDRYMVEIKSTTCPFHKANPGKPFAGCTCSTSYGQVERSPEEVAAIKRAKRLAREEQILAEAAAIRARRRAEGIAHNPSSTPRDERE